MREIIKKEIKEQELLSSIGFALTSLFILRFVFKWDVDKLSIIGFWFAFFECFLGFKRIYFKAQKNGTLKFSMVTSVGLLKNIKAKLIVNTLKGIINIVIISGSTMIGTSGYETYYSFTKTLFLIVAFMCIHGTMMLLAINAKSNRFYQVSMVLEMIAYIAICMIIGGRSGFHYIIGRDLVVILIIILTVYMIILGIMYMRRLDEKILKVELY